MFDKENFKNIKQGMQRVLNRERPEDSQIQLYIKVVKETQAEIRIIKPVNMNNQQVHGKVKKAKLDHTTLLDARNLG